MGAIHKRDHPSFQYDSSRSQAVYISSSRALKNHRNDLVNQGLILWDTFQKNAYSYRCNSRQKQIMKQTNKKRIHFIGNQDH